LRDDTGDAALTDRVWLAGQFASAVVFSIPTIVLTTAGVRHVAHYGEPWILYAMSVMWFWGPGLLLAIAAYFQLRQPSLRAGWRMSVVAAVAMSCLSIFVLSSLARQDDVHWGLWSMWIAAAVAALIASATVVVLRPSRRTLIGQAAQS
jgi:hypothetical protein